MKKITFVVICLAVVLIMFSCSTGKIISSKTFNTKDSVQVIVWKDKNGISMVIWEPGKDPCFHNPGGRHSSFDQVVISRDSVSSDSAHIAIQSTSPAIYPIYQKGQFRYPYHYPYPSSKSKAKAGSPSDYKVLD